MERSFPPFDEVTIEDGTVKELLSTHNIFTSLVEQLSKESLVPDLAYTDVDEFLSRELVSKIDLSEIPSEDTYDQMSTIGNIFFHSIDDLTASTIFSHIPNCYLLPLPRFMQAGHTNAFHRARAES